jgi:hypothetical protein
MPILGITINRANGYEAYRILAFFLYSYKPPWLETMPKSGIVIERQSAVPIAASRKIHPEGI